MTKAEVGGGSHFHNLWVATCRSREDGAILLDMRCQLRGPPQNQPFSHFNHDVQQLQQLAKLLELGYLTFFLQLQG